MDYSDDIDNEILLDGIRYSKKYDSYYDMDTLIWLERLCKDPKCSMCQSRPPRFPWMKVVVNNDRASGVGRISSDMLI